MTNEQYDKMIELLKETTQNDKLKWNYNKSSDKFYTYINDCKIELNIRFNAGIQDSIASIELFNQDGLSFATYSFYSKVDVDDYNKLNDLDDIVRDKYYKITESESIIISGLEKINDLISL